MHAWRGRKELSRASQSDLIVLSRAKSGRTWLRAMLSRLYQAHYNLDEAQLMEFDNFHQQNSAIPKVLYTHGYYLHADIDAGGPRSNAMAKKIIFLVRNPCDVAVSEYFQSTKRANQTKVELYGIDTDMPMFDFVMTGPMGIPTIVDYLNKWERVLAPMPNVMRVRYEDLRAEPVEYLSTLVDFIGAPFSEETIRNAVEFTSFENLKKKEREDFYNNSRLRAKNPDDPDSYKVRRGKVGGYRDYFDDSQIAKMEALVRERISPVFAYGEEQPAAEAASR